MSRLLVVVDMQKDFVDGALGSPEARAIVPDVLDKVKAYRDAGDAIRCLASSCVISSLWPPEAMALCSATRIL